MAIESKTLITISDAARTIGVSRQTIHSWIKKGKLFPVRIMGLPYLSLEAVLKLKK